MIYPKDDPLEWARRYGIHTDPSKCMKCGAEVRFNIPFAYCKYRGLLSDHTECGDEFRQAVFSYAKGEDRKDLIKLFVAAQGWAK